MTNQSLLVVCMRRPAKIKEFIKLQAANEALRCHMMQTFHLADRKYQQVTDDTTRISQTSPSTEFWHQIFTTVIKQQQFGCDEEEGRMLGALSLFFTADIKPLILRRTYHYINISCSRKVINSSSIQLQPCWLSADSSVKKTKDKKAIKSTNKSQSTITCYIKYLLSSINDGEQLLRHFVSWGCLLDDLTDHRQECMEAHEDQKDI